MHSIKGHYKNRWLIDAIILRQKTHRRISKLLQPHFTLLSKVRSFIILWKPHEDVGFLLVDSFSEKISLSAFEPRTSLRNL